MLDELTLLAGVDGQPVGIGLDGCGLPTYALPLAAAARAYAALADPGAAGLDDERARAVERIVGAMTAEPAMVAGPGRFTTRLMEVTGGRVLGKEGAEGFYAAAVRGPVALGLALKIADGSEACRDGVVIELLRQLGALSGGEFAELREFHTHPHHPQLERRAGRADRAGPRARGGLGWSVRQLAVARPRRWRSWRRWPPAAARR